MNRRKPVVSPALAAPVALVALVATDVAAFVIGSDAVFDRFVEKQAQDQPVDGELVGRVTVDDPAGPVLSSVRADVRFPGFCAFTVETPEGPARVTLSDGGLTVDEAVPSPLAAVAALGCPFATFKGIPASQAEKQVKRLVEKLGVDPATVSLSHLDRRAAWVVGARPRQLDRPQLWFDKTSNRVLRVIARYDGRLWDVRFTRPSSIATAHRLARLVEVYEQGERRLAMRLMTAEGGAVEGESEETIEEEEEP